MKTLTINTAFDEGYIALVEDGALKAETAVERGHLESQTFVELMKLGVQPNLEGIDLIALAAGPGSFTGLKIGAVVAKSLSYLQKIPFKGVGTLPWLAACEGQGIVLAFIRSHGDRFYWGVYDCGGNGNTFMVPKELISPKCGKVDEIIEVVESRGIAGQVIAVGFKRESSSPVFPWNIHRTELPVAVLARLAEAGLASEGPDDPLTFTPMYVARSQAEEKSGPPA